MVREISIGRGLAAMKTKMLKVTFPLANLGFRLEIVPTLSVCVRARVCVCVRVCVRVLRYNIPIGPHRKKHLFSAFTIMGFFARNIRFLSV